MPASLPPARFSPERYCHGEAGPVAVIPGRVAAWLDRQMNLGRLRIEHRGMDPELDSVLLALTSVAQAWRARQGLDASPQRTPVALDDEPKASSGLMTTSEAADRLDITQRAVQQAISKGRLPARRHGRVWMVDREDVEHYQEAREAC